MDIMERLEKYPREEFFVRNFRLADELLQDAKMEIASLRVLVKHQEERIKELLFEND